MSRLSQPPPIRFSSDHSEGLDQRSMIRPLVSCLLTHELNYFFAWR
jgi:hypothetical protein